MDKIRNCVQPLLYAQKIHCKNYAEIEWRQKIETIWTDNIKDYMDNGHCNTLPIVYARMFISTLA